MARGPQLRSAPLALPSVRDATHCVIFARTFNSQLRYHIHLISTSPDLCTSAPPPSPQPSSRGIVGRRLRQLRFCVADFPHSASHSLQSCSVVRVSLSIVGRPSSFVPPSARLSGMAPAKAPPLAFLCGCRLPLPGGLQATLSLSGRPRVSKIRVHASFTQLQPLLHTSPAGR